MSEPPTERDDATDERGEYANPGDNAGDEVVGAPFAISLSPSNRTILQSDFASFFVDVEPVDGFADDVTLTFISDPPLVVLFLDLFPDVVTPPDFAFLSFSTLCDTAPGDYTLTVTGTSDDGATASGSAALTVEPRGVTPTADFFISGIFDDNPLSFQFFDESRASGCEPVDIVSRTWDFGDGTTSSEENPSHVYAAPGDFTVTLTVIDANGLSASASQTVSIPPILSIFRITRDPARLEFRVDLRWVGGKGDLLDLQRNFSLVDIIENDGEHRDVFRRRETEFNWRVCEPGGSFDCSNIVSVDFGPNQGNQATVRTEIDGNEVVETVVIEDED